MLDRNRPRISSMLHPSCPMPRRTTTMTESLTSRDAVVARIAREKAVAVVRADSADALVDLSRALIDGGVSCVEITMTVPNALDAIARVSRELGDAALVGVGSVTDPETARRAVEAGAQYVVSPVFIPAVVEAAHAAGAAAMPGCLTPTEAFAAHSAGADVVKVFPADVVGMAFFKGVLAPMPFLKLMPTGGVTLDNAGEWLAAGAVAVGVGSALVDKKAVAAGDWATLTANAKRLRAAIDAAA